MGVPRYVVQHLRGAMADYQTGHMSGAERRPEVIRRRREIGMEILAHDWIGEIRFPVFCRKNQVKKNARQ